MTGLGQPPANLEGTVISRGTVGFGLGTLQHQQLGRQCPVQRQLLDPCPLAFDGPRRTRLAIRVVRPVPGIVVCALVLTRLLIVFVSHEPSLSSRVVRWSCVVCVQGQCDLPP